MPTVSSLVFAATDRAFCLTLCLSRIGRIERPLCSTCSHPIQDISHVIWLILHYPATNSLRHLLFGNFFSRYNLWPRPSAVGFCSSIISCHTPIPQKGLNNNNNNNNIVSKKLPKNCKQTTSLYAFTMTTHQQVWKDQDFCKSRYTDTVLAQYDFTLSLEISCNASFSFKLFACYWNNTKWPIADVLLLPDTQRRNSKTIKVMFAPENFIDFCSIKNLSW